MPIVNQGWAYVSSSTFLTPPGGADKEVQFNEGGAFGGDSEFTWDTTAKTLTITGSLTASVLISASTYYGDGSNLTGITASAVNVADGPEYSIQFRRDFPISGEISGSQNLKFISNNQLNLTGAMHIKDSATTATADPNYADIVIAKNGTAGVSVLSSDGTSAALLLGSPTDNVASEHLYAPASNYSQIGHARAGGYVRLTSGDRQEVLRLDANQHVTASGDITASGHISASTFTGDSFKGSGMLLSPLSAQTTNRYRILTSDGSGQGQISDNSSDATITSTKFSMGMMGSPAFISAFTGSVVISGTNSPGGGPSKKILDVTGFNSGSILFVTGSNRVGINNADPAAALHVSTGSLGTDAARFEGDVVIAGFGNLTVCQGTASIAHLSGCSPITVHSPMSSSQSISASAYYFGPNGRQVISDTTTDMSILAQSTGMFISADGGSVILQGQVDINQSGVLSSSQTISASAFYANGVELVPGGGGAGAVSTTTDNGNTDRYLPFVASATGVASASIFISDALSLKPASGSLTLDGEGEQDVLEEGFFTTTSSYGASIFLKGSGVGASADTAALITVVSSSFTIPSGAFGNPSPITKEYETLEIGAPSGKTQGGNLSLSGSGDLSITFANTETATFGSIMEFGGVEIGLYATESSVGDVFSINNGNTDGESYARLDFDDAQWYFGDGGTSGSIRKFTTDLTGTFNAGLSVHNASASFNRGIEVGGLAESKMEVFVTASFNNITTFNNEATADAGFLTTRPATDGAQMWLSSSTPTLPGPGNKVYGDIFFGSGSFGGGWSGASLSLRDFSPSGQGPRQELMLLEQNGDVVVRSTNHDAVIRANAGQVILNGGTGIVFNNNLYSTASNIVWGIHSGSNGRAIGPDSGNGGLNLFVTTSAGPRDYLKFHTSGSSPGVVFGNNVYMNMVGNNELQPTQNTNFYVSSSVNGYVTRTSAQQVFSNAAGTGLTATNSQLHLDGGPFYRTFESVGTTPFTASATYPGIYRMRTNVVGTGSMKVLLPQISGSTDIDGITLSFKDTDGQAGTGNIVLETHSSDDINGAASYTIDANYGSVTVVGDAAAASWWVMSKS